jgi:16S rRNA (guanine527-N7)-methyltransferase
VITTEEEARRWVASLSECDALALERLERFIELLKSENQKQNLVSAASLDAVWQRHIADSAQLLAYVPRGTGPWLDLGTGAGFPGLVAATLRPECEFVLVESRARRIEWLERAATALGLENTVVEGCRLELLQSRNVGVISARAFAPLEKLLSLSSRFSTSETLWLLPKGRSAQQELDELKGWRHMFHVEQSLTDQDSGIIVGKLTGRKGKSA